MQNQNSQARSSVRFALAVIALTLFASFSTTAQTVSGSLQGIVKDSKGSVIAGADVVIRNMETGQERTLKANGDGFYIATFLPLGRYTVSATATGISKTAQENIDITLNQTRNVDFQLNPSGVTEAVIVTADAAPINTSNAEIKGTLNTREILDKPTFN